MCCAQGLPLQVAVNRLLKATRPDRLIIESSGIGHPSGVLKTLKGEGFKHVLTLQAGICLLDPQNLLNTSLRHNALFIEQLACADVLVANKVDRASLQALQAFTKLANSYHTPKAVIAETMQGRLSPQWLTITHTPRPLENPLSEQAITEPVITDTTDHAVLLQSESFSYPLDTCFQLDAIKRWIKSIQLPRLKGILLTEQGHYLFNYAAGTLQCEAVERRVNALQLIAPQLDRKKLATELDQCRCPEKK